ncbi:MAG: hypothetical protein ACI3ZQ_00830 [Candidatus Cryptobacteroides sp.]
MIIAGLPWAIEESRPFDFTPLRVTKLNLTKNDKERCARSKARLPPLHQTTPPHSKKRNRKKSHWSISKKCDYREAVAAYRTPPHQWRMPLTGAVCDCRLGLRPVA